MPAGMSGGVHGASADSLATVLRAVEQAVADGADAGQLGGDLFSVSLLLDVEPSLRRVATDPATPAQAKTDLLRAVLSERIGEAAVDVVAEAARQRWSRSRHLADSLEHAGVVAQVLAAERSGTADELEDELFRFGRVVTADPGLRDVLTDRTTPTARKVDVVRSLLGDKATAPTVRLAEQAAAGRHRTFTVGLDEFSRVAASRRERVVATVRVATMLADDDKQRLAEALERQYDRQVHLNVVVDPAVLGGLRVEIGDEVIDGSVASRLDEARRRLAG